MKKENWIPVSSGLFPNEMEDVQITFIGWNDNEPYCNAFAYRKEGKWYWSLDDYEVKVEITAWKYNCEPYKPSEFPAVFLYTVRIFWYTTGILYTLLHPW